jgi:hypothetical protein
MISVPTDVDVRCHVDGRWAQGESDERQMSGDRFTWCVFLAHRQVCQPGIARPSTITLHFHVYITR